MRHIIFFIALWMIGMIANAQTCQPEAVYETLLDGEKDDASTGESAPLPAHFYAHPIDTVGWNVRYEWTIARQDTPDEYILHRFDENIDYTFRESGAFTVTLRATFTCGNDTVMFGEVGSGDDNTFTVSIQQSILEFPNTITPNGDGYNDVLRAKEGYQSIVSFRASIFTRWGVRLYEWDDLAGGWDGRYNGSVVKDGVYYLVVEAKGADGREYDIRKAINVLTSSNKQNGQHATD